MMKRYEIIGIILTLLGATLWGVSGTSVQFVGNFRNMNLEWLLTMRLITAGLLTVLYGWIRQGSAIFNVFRNWRDTLGLVHIRRIWYGPVPIYLFPFHRHRRCGHCDGAAIFGAVYDYHYLLMRYGKRPSTGEIISVILALVGTICLMGNNGFSF